MHKLANLQSFSEQQKKKQSLVKYLPDDIMEVIEESYIQANFSVEEIIECHLNKYYKKFVQLRDRHINLCAKYDNFELIKYFIEEKKYKLSVNQTEQIFLSLFYYGDLNLLKWFKAQAEAQGRVEKIEFMFLLTRNEIKNFEIIDYLYQENLISDNDNEVIMHEIIFARHFKLLKWIVENRNKLPKRCIEMSYVGDVEVLDWLETVKDKFLFKITDDAYNKAISNGQLESVMWLDQHYPELAKNMDFLYLHYAASRGFVDMIEYILVTKKVQITDRVFPQLRNIAENGHLDMLKWFEANTPYRANVDCLHLAIQNGHLEVVEWLSKKSNFMEFLSPSDCIVAAEEGHFNTVKWFYENYHKVSDYADIEPDNTVVLQFLVRMCNDVEQLQSLNFKPSDFTIITMEAACKNGNLEIIKWVHENYTKAFSSTNTAHSESPYDTPSFMFLNVIEYGELEVVKWVFENCFAHQTQANTIQQVHLEYASESKDLNILKWLMDCPYADKDSLTVNSTMLYGACYMANYEMAEWMLEGEKKKDFSNQEHLELAFRIVCNQSDYDIAKLLILHRIPFSEDSMHVCNDDRISELLEQNRSLCKSN